MVAILVLLTILTFLTVDYFAQRSAAHRAVPATAPARRPMRVMAPADLGLVPAGVFMDLGHTWARLEPSGELRVGADRLPATLLGGVERVEALPAGSEVGRGDPVAVLHHGGRSLPVRSPVDGRVAAVNAPLEAEPGRLAADPYGQGWLCTIAPRGLGGALRRLLVAEEAQAWMRRELASLRDFLVGMGERGALATATLPDGGLPVEGLAGRLAEGDWNELAERFFGAPAGG